MRLHQSLCLLLALLFPAVQAAILAIDYGAEFTKLSLVKPGVPFDVLLDRDSKRKISSVVSWKRNDRVFGQEAKQASVRFPNTHFPYVKPLLANNSLPELPLYPNPPVITAEGELIFSHPATPSHVNPQPDSHDQVWTPTALLAHQLSYYRGLAEEMAQETVSQVVVTVPAWWNQHQRRAYRDALELQGLQCLAMIGEGTGVALNYAMTRTFPDFDPETGLGEREYHVVYDSGALSTSATVLALYQTSYRPTPKSKMLINTTHIDVLGVGWEDVGALQIDMAVQDLLTADFIAKSGRADVRQDKRAMAKLAREAVRVKHILSANQQAMVGIESLFDDIDFRSSITRRELEEQIQGSYEMYESPLNKAIAAAGLDLDDIQSFILFGGNTRVPFVQSAVREVLGDKESLIAQNVNSDEAAVLGAAFYGAGISRQFKMKNIEILERSIYDISLGDEVIFPAGTPLGQRRAITFAPKDELSLEFSQDGKPVVGVTIPEVKEALANFTGASPVVNMTLRLDARGLFGVGNAALVSNVTESEQGGVAGALKGLFGKKSEATEAAVNEDAEDAETADADAETEPAPKAVKPQRIPLKFRERALGVKPLSGEEKRTTNARLRSIATYEAAIQAREAARNHLEAYLYDLQNVLSHPEDRQMVFDFSTEAERGAISSLVEKTFEWLHENAEDAPIQDLIDRREALKVLEAPIITRIDEWNSRPDAINNFQQAMFAGRAFLVEATKNRTAALEAAEKATPESPVAPPKFTEEELNGVKDLLKDLEVWMDALMTEQVKLSDDKTSNPVIFTADLNERGRGLQAHVQRLEKKKNPRVPRPRPSSSASEGYTSAKASASSASEPETSSTSSSTSAQDSEKTQEGRHDEL